MGLGSFLGLDIGKKGVLTHQQAINVTGHNVTNAQAKGYSRQVVAIKASDPIDTQAVAGQLGSGVSLDEIVRVRDQFIDSALRDQKSFENTVITLDEKLNSIQTILNEPSDNNVRAGMDELFQSLEDVNNQPENSAIRVTLVERAKSLSTLINVTYNRLQDEIQATNQAIEGKVLKVNSIAKSLADLNIEISKVKNGGQNPNDLLDARDVMLDELSELVNIDVREDVQDTMFVRIGEHLLLQGSKVSPLQLVTDPFRNGLKSLSRNEFKEESSTQPAVVRAHVGGDAVAQSFTVTVFQTAKAHKLQSLVLDQMRNNITSASTLEQAGITSGSVYVNGVQLYFDNTITFEDLRDKINGSGQGVEAFFERGKMVMKAVKTGTANQITLSDGTSNLLKVMGFSSDKEINQFGEVLFDGSVRDARYAVGRQTINSSTNYIENIVEGVDIELLDAGSSNIRVNPLVKEGAIKGLQEYQDGYLVEQARNLDKLAYAMIKEFNKVHFEGFGLDGQSQRLFFEDYNSPDGSTPESGAARNIAVARFLANDVKVFAAARGVFQKDGDKVPVSSGNGDGNKALDMAQLKFAKIVENTEYGLRTRLSILNGGNGVDVGRKDSNFVVSNGSKNAVVSLAGFDEDSTLFDLQNKINSALTNAGINSQVALSPLADGRMRLTSNNESLTFFEGAGSSARDLSILPSSGAVGNGTRMIESSNLSAKFRGQPKSLSDFFSNVVSTVGVKAEQISLLKDNAKVVSTQIEAQRLSVSGVSVDEELTNLIQFQQGYNASARIISAVNEMLDVVVNLGR